MNRCRRPQGMRYRRVAYRRHLIHLPRRQDRRLRRPAMGQGRLLPKQPAEVASGWTRRLPVVVVVLVAADHRTADLAH